MTTGVVKEIDNLGRVVIPKSIRAALGVSNESTVEMLLSEMNKEKVLIVKKHSEHKTVDWGKAKNLLGHLLPNFLLYDADGEFVASYNMAQEALSEASGNHQMLVSVGENGEKLAYIVIPANSELEKAVTANKVLQSFLLG